MPTTDEARDESSGADGDDGSRLDRELAELLQELRVLLPGIQVLFAFLLTVPFAQRFATISDFQKTTYFTAFLATTFASVLLVAPGVHHRLRWRRHDKEHLLRTANRETVLGTLLLAVAVDAVSLLIGDFLYDRAVGVVVAVAVGLVTAAVWWAGPLARSRRDAAAPERRAPTGV